MTRFEWFESGAALVGFKVGGVSVDLLTKYDLYKTYKKFIDSGETKSEARKLTSDASGCHYTTVARAIYWFEND